MTMVNRRVLWDENVKAQINPPKSNKKIILISEYTPRKVKKHEK